MSEILDLCVSMWHLISSYLICVWPFANTNGALSMSVFIMTALEGFQGPLTARGKRVNESAEIRAVPQMCWGRSEWPLHITMYWFPQIKSIFSLVFICHVRYTLNISTSGWCKSKSKSAKAITPGLYLKNLSHVWQHLDVTELTYCPILYWKPRDTNNTTYFILTCMINTFRKHLKENAANVSHKV